MEGYSFELVSYTYVRLAEQADATIYHSIHGRPRMGPQQPPPYVTPITVNLVNTDPRYYWDGTPQAMIYLLFLHNLNNTMKERGYQGDYSDLNAEEIEEARLYIEEQLQAGELVCVLKTM
jgi:hypothetical protein